MPPFSEGETEAHRRDTLHPGPQGESHQDFSAYLLVKGSNPPDFTTDRERKGASGLSTPLLLTFGAGVLCGGGSSTRHRTFSRGLGSP